MAISCFLTYWGEAQDTEAVFEAYRAGPATFLAETPDVLSVELYTPDSASDPMLDGDIPPLLVVQLRFATLAGAERGLGSDAVARALSEFQDMPVSNWHAAVEVMRGQIYPDGGEADGDTTRVPIIYLVDYQRPADDEAAFIDYYCANHPPLLAELPGIRRLEIYTPVDWTNPLALDRADTMLICDVSFDTADALTAALHSEVRERLREDYHLFPPFTGRVGHYPMRRVRVMG
jgi:uncharacterized protein (TIGR02118 family)